MQIILSVVVVGLVLYYLHIINKRYFYKSLFQEVEKSKKSK